MARNTAKFKKTKHFVIHPPHFWLQNLPTHRVIAAQMTPAMVIIEIANAIKEKALPKV